MKFLDKTLSLYFSFIVLIMVFAFVGLEIDQEQRRELASNSLSLKESCKSSLNKILLKNVNWLKLAPDMSKETEQIDFDLLLKYRNHFAGKKASEVGPTKDVESVFAWLEEFAMVDKSSITAMKKSEMDQLVKYSKDVLEGRFNGEDLESFLSMTYERLLGADIKTLDVFAGDKRLRELMALKVSKEFAMKGLEKFAKEYGLFSEPSKFSKILNSKHTKRLMTMIMNIPIIYGMPPLYLPGVKQLEIPQKYGVLMLKNGLDFELYKKTLKAMNVKDKKYYTLSHAGRVRYEAFRRQYNRGVGVVLSILAIQYYNFEETSLSEEENLLDESIDSINDEIDRANEELSLVDNISDSMDLKIDPKCRSFKRCLEFSRRTTGELPVVGSDDYKACKEFRDPDNNCRNL